VTTVSSYRCALVIRYRPHRSAALVAVVAALAATLSFLAPSASGEGREGPVTIVQSDAGTDPVGAAAAYAQLMTIPSRDSGAIYRSHAPQQTGADDCPAVRCRDVRPPVPNGVRIISNRTRVILPVGYDKPANRNKRYPVVYFWNGARSDYAAWTFKTELLQMSRSWDAIFVMPSGGYNNRAGMMSDWYDGSFQWETWHTGTVVPWIDNHFRTIRGARAMVGASMGGLGVFTYAAHHPKMFKAVLSISGLVDTTALSAAGIDERLNDALDLPKPYLRRIWGDPVLNRDVWNDHNPTWLAPKLRGLKKVLITSGTGYPGTTTDIHSGETERRVWEEHRTFLAALTASRVPFSVRVMEGGIHNWNFFNNPLRWAMPQLIAATRS
jgi:diacylglycerol O-acyltransferase / trehalose O-mycolyltransferase